MRNLLVVLLLLILFGGSTLAESTALDLGDYTLEYAYPLGEPEILGDRALSVRYPADAPADRMDFELVLATYPSDAVAIMREAGIDPFTMARSTFLNLSGEPEQINKTLFLGTTAARTVYTREGPRPHVLHVFQGRLESGAVVTLGLRVFQDSEASSAMISAIANTFAPR